LPVLIVRCQASPSSNHNGVMATAEQNSHISQTRAIQNVKDRGGMPPSRIPQVGSLQGVGQPGGRTAKMPGPMVPVKAAVANLAGRLHGAFAPIGQRFEGGEA